MWLTLLKAGAHQTPPDSWILAPGSSSLRRGRSRLSYRVFLGILDRYLLKSFFLFFAYSMFGILGIWLVYQLGVEGARFLELHLSFRVIALYYLAQTPYLVVMWMPLAALLALRGC